MRVESSSPPKLQSVGKGMRMLGMSERVDELEVGMNRAAGAGYPNHERRRAPRPVWVSLTIAEQNSVRVSWPRQASPISSAMYCRMAAVTERDQIPLRVLTRVAATSWW